MALAHSPSIVTDGLVLYLDAGNTKSYPGSGTTWTDLSGRRNNGTLTNGPTYSSANGGSIVFDGTNDYVDIQSSTDFTFGTSGDVTIEAWVYQTANSSIRTVYHSGDATGLSVTLSSGNLRIQNDATEFSISSTPLQLNTWNHILVVRRGGSLVGYTNGSISNAAVANTTDFTQSGPTVGYWKYANRGLYFSGYISNLRVLKGKGLTAAEIQQNFNALRGRYGI